MLPLLPLLDLLRPVALPVQGRGAGMHLVCLLPQLPEPQGGVPWTHPALVPTDNLVPGSRARACTTPAHRGCGAGGGDAGTNTGVSTGGR